MLILAEEHEKKAYPSVWDARPQRFPSFQVGQTQPLSVGIMRRIRLPWDSRIFTPIDVEDWTIQAAFGGGFVLPVAGRWPATWGGDTVENISYNPTQEELSDALNSLDAIDAAGGVMVQGKDGFFQVTFNTVGARALITADPSELSPLSIIDIQEVVAGDADTSEVQTIRITQNVGALATLSEDSDAASASVATVQTGDATHNHKVRVTLPTDRYGGTWTYTSASVESEPLGYDDSGGQIKTILEAISSVGTGNVSVEQESADEFLITYIGAKALTAIAGISVSGTNLRVLSLKSGTLDLRSAGVEMLLNGSEQKVVYLELEGTPASGTPQKLLRQPVLLTRPVLERAAVAPPDVGTFLTAEQFAVLYYSKAQIDALVGDSADIVVGAAGTTDLAPASAFMQWLQRVTATAGAGAYTHKFTLDSSRAKDGAIFRVVLELPTSSNPTIEFYDNTTAGTALQTVTGVTGTATYFMFEAEFNGTNWAKIDGRYIQSP